MADINEIIFSGTIHKLYRLKTKAGNSFAKVLLKVGKDTFWVLGYGNVASALMQANEGDPLAITGTAQMNNWKDETGDWHNDFNAVAWTVEIDGQQVKYKKSEPAKQNNKSVAGSQQPRQQNNQDQAPPPDDRDLSQYDAEPGGYF